MNIERHRGSRLPDDPAYWEHLAQRTVEAAFTTRPPEWWRGMSDAAFVLAASAVLALVGGSLLLDDRLDASTTATHEFTGAFAPDDALLRVLLTSDAAPPPASVLLRLVAVREEER